MRGGPARAEVVSPISIATMLIARRGNRREFIVQSPRFLLLPTFKQTPVKSRMLTIPLKDPERSGNYDCKTRSSRLLFANRCGRLRPRTLPMAPNRDVVKTKCVPPPVKHRLVETQDSFLGDTRRRRCELPQSIVNEDSLRL